MIRYRIRWIVGLSFLLNFAWLGGGCSEPSNTVRIGCKNYTEQFILGEIMAQWIEARTDLNVQRIWNLGGTMICHQALVNGRIDLYPEYTGTGYISILNQTQNLPSDETLDYVREAYTSEFASAWLPPFGFSNSYAITVRQTDAEQNGWNSISDLAADASHLRAGFTAEFAERQDGYPAFKEHYGFSFSGVTDLDPGLMYSAMDQNEVDVISAFSTDGRILELNLTVLEDDRRFFPPYDAAPVVRLEALRRFPALRETLEQLHNRIDASAMRRMNFAVDSGQTNPAAVARAFLVDEGFIQSSAGKRER